MKPILTLLLSALTGLAATTFPVLTDVPQRTFTGGGTNIALLNGTNSFTRPITAPGIPRLLYKSSAETTHTGNTDITTLSTFTIPANTVGSNDMIGFQAVLSRGTLGTVQYWVEIAGTNIWTSGTVGANPAFPFVGSLGFATLISVANNSTASQLRAVNDAGNGTWSMTSAIDFTADVLVSVKVQLAVGTDASTNRSWSLFLYPAP